MSWKTFLKAHWGAVAAIAFFTIEGITWQGLVRSFVLFVIDLKTRRVEIAGIVASPDGEPGCIRSLKRLRPPDPIVVCVCPESGASRSRDQL